MPRRTLTILVLALVTALGMGACSSDTGNAVPSIGVDDRDAAESPSPGEDHASSEAGGVETDAVSIKDFEFNPDKIAAPSGATITVSNDDKSRHTLTADDASFETGVLEPGESKTITVTGDSVAPFHCEIHNFMTGEFVVEAA